MLENSNSQKNNWGDNVAAVFIFFYVTAVSAAVVWGIVTFWPNTPVPEVVETSYFGVHKEVSGELLMLIITLLTGALGGTLHAIRSYFFWVGRREFSKDYTSWYLLKPIAGSFAAFIFYLVVRGGFFTPGTSIEGASPYGFAALAGLVGLFSDQAVEKLKEVAENLFTKPKEIEEEVEEEE